jgi:hypothetical protein
MSSISVKSQPSRSKLTENIIYRSVTIDDGSLNKLVKDLLATELASFGKQMDSKFAVSFTFTL